MTEFGLSHKTIQQIRDVFRRYPVIQQVKIYGSRAMGRYEKGSDIDLAFYAQTEDVLEGRLLTDLDELATPYLFDVTDYYKISSLPLKEHIDTFGKIFYQRGNH